MELYWAGKWGSSSHSACVTVLTRMVTCPSEGVNLKALESRLKNTFSISASSKQTLYLSGSSLFNTKRISRLSATLSKEWYISRIKEEKLKLVFCRTVLPASYFCISIRLLTKSNIRPVFFLINWSVSFISGEKDTYCIRSFSGLMMSVRGVRSSCEKLVNMRIRSSCNSLTLSCSICL